MRNDILVPPEHKVLPLVGTGQETACVHSGTSLKLNFCFAKLGGGREAVVFVGISPVFHFSYQIFVDISEQIFLHLLYDLRMIFRGLFFKKIIFTSFSGEQDHWGPQAVISIEVNL